MVKHSRFAKIRENRESFPLERFDVYGIATCMVSLQPSV